MAWQIHFTCDNAEYSSATSVVERAGQVEIWRAANVSVREVTPGHRWLIVLIEREAKPVIWRAISGEWTLGIEEQTMAISLQQLEPDASSGRVQKLRFQTQTDLWSFVAQIAFTRIDVITTRAVGERT
ncbi:hypothetical protein ONZ51_g7560 [Trametes cubensis]|uniref:Uncharacterized protein n=1 Tax=Trametes cubensis TaxID=1111947 RepID=A0AAD7TPY3_9APHY|nr:hypothetical protein ONZ51_g7560 [Trametes cubensis]